MMEKDLIWRARRDLNPRPCAPEAHALIQLSYGRAVPEMASKL